MRISIVPYVAMLAAVASLAACSTEPYKRTVWVNPGVPEDRQRIQLRADADTCWKLASDAIPEPSLRNMGMRIRDRLGWQVINQRDDEQMHYVAVCLALKGWKPEQRTLG